VVAVVQPHAHVHGAERVAGVSTARAATGAPPCSTVMSALV
jgi:hypothetical protein